MDHPIVSRDEWLAARKAHLKAEKALTRQRDKVLAARRALPWVKVEKPYIFEGPDGPVKLADLFDAARLVDQLDNIHFFSRSMVARDMPDSMTLDIDPLSHPVWTGGAQRLVDRGILATRRNGSNIYYRVVDPCVPVLLERGLCLIECCPE